jgi:long-chain fatty acid transport protein
MGWRAGPHARTHRSLTRIGSRRRGLAALLAGLGLGLAAPGLAHGDGFRVLDQGAAATAQGAAFAAQADDPSAIHYNPAGMTQLPGLQIYFGTNLVSGNTTFNSTAGANTRGGTDGTVSNPPPSSFYLTSSFREMGVRALEDLTLGVGIAAPFGLQVTYPSNGPLSTVTTYATLPLLDIKPTAAYRLTRWLSVGAGLDIYTFSSLIGDGQAEQKRLAGPEFAPLGIPPGSALEVNGTDSAVGFNLSALVTPWSNPDGKPRLNLGLVYRHGATLNLKGNFVINSARVAGAEIEFNLPWILTGAVAAWPLRDAEREWKLELDVDYVDWTSFKNLDIKLSNGVTLPFPQNWTSTYVVMAGTEYRWLVPPGLPGWEVAARAGYIYSATPVPTKTFVAAIPDANYNAFSVGLGLQCRPPGRLLGLLPCGTSEQGRWWAPKGMGLDVAYQAVLYDSRQISNNDDPRVNGRWSTTTHVGSISLRFNF